MNNDTPKTSNSDGKQKAKRAAEDVGHAAKDAARDISAKAKAEASNLADKAYDVADSKLEEGKAEATAQMDRTAEQIRNAGHEFGDDSYQAQAAEYLASNLSQAAEMIRGKDLGALVDDVTLFARRNPALFLGGAALLGFAAARLMKASERDGRTTDYASGNYEGGGYEGGAYDRAPRDGGPYDGTPYGGASYEREPYV